MTTQEIIAKYPKIFEDYESNPRQCNWYGVPKGWLPIIDELCGCIQNHIDSIKTYTKEGMTSPSQVKCLQMKEKFGELRFYTFGHTDVIDGMIRYAAHRCDNTCDRCGSHENLGYTGQESLSFCTLTVVNISDYCFVEGSLAGFNDWSKM